MADQNFALYTPPEVVSIVGGPLVHNQQVARALNPITPPSTVVSIYGLQHRQLSRTVVLLAGQGSSSTPTVIHYQMLGARVSDSVWITWGVTGTPDTSGVSAPQPVIISSITVTRRWVT